MSEPKDPKVLWWESVDFHFGDDFPPTVCTPENPATFTWRLGENSIWMHNAEKGAELPGHLPEGWVWGIRLQPDRHDDGTLGRMNKNSQQVVLRYQLEGSQEVVEVATYEKVRFDPRAYFPKLRR